MNLRKIPLARFFDGSANPFLFFKKFLELYIADTLVQSIKLFFFSRFRKLKSQQDFMSFHQVFSTFFFVRSLKYSETLMST